MEYKNILNKEFRIVGIHIADLTMDYVKSFLGQWNDGSAIGSLTMYYDKKQDYVVINLDNPNYKKVITFAESYINAFNQMMEQNRDQIDPRKSIEEINVLNGCIYTRLLSEMIMNSPKKRKADKDLDTVCSGQKVDYLSIKNGFDCGYVRGYADALEEKR